MPLILGFLQENAVFVVSAMLVAGLVGVSAHLQQRVDTSAPLVAEAASMPEVAAPASASQAPVVSTKASRASEQSVAAAQQTASVVATSTSASSAVVTAPTTAPIVPAIRVREGEDFDDD